MQLATKMSDDELAAYFEAFDFENAQQTGRSALQALHWAAQFRDYANDTVAEIVAEARQSGATWTEIGEALGVSHQAAMKRYRRSA